MRLFKKNAATCKSAEDFLNNDVFEGSYGEEWSLRKLCRRFIWHDRIHAKALWRLSKRLRKDDTVANPFYFV